MAAPAAPAKPAAAKPKKKLFPKLAVIRADSCVAGQAAKAKECLAAGGYAGASLRVDPSPASVVSRPFDPGRAARMQPLTLDDLLPLEEYVGRRPEIFATQARYVDRYRRVRIGPKLTLIFENRQTLWFRVQEVLRIARLADPLRVQQELDWYNRLLPGRDRLQAALGI